MRAHAFAGLAIIVFASLPACQKLEQKAEAKAKAAVEKKIVASAMGGSFSSGTCPGWPSTVPVYPGASEVGCVSLDPQEAEKSPIVQALANAGPTPSGAQKDDGVANGPATKGFLLSFHSDVDRSKIISFYDGALPYERSAGSSIFANLKNPADPVVTVSVLPSSPAAPNGFVLSVLMQVPK